MAVYTNLRMVGRSGWSTVCVAHLMMTHGVRGIDLCSAAVGALSSLRLPLYCSFSVSEVPLRITLIRRHAAPPPRRLW